MLPSENTELHEGILATYWFGEAGILFSKSKPPRRTIENVTENIAFVKKITNNKKVCLLVYISNSGKPDKATRDFVAQQLPGIYKAMAMVSNSSLGKLIMNLIFGLQKPNIPMKSFSSEKEAVEWLKQYQ